MTILQALDFDQWMITNKRKALTKPSIRSSRESADRSNSQSIYNGYFVTAKKLARADEASNQYPHNSWEETRNNAASSFDGPTLDNCTLFTLPSILIDGVPMVTDGRMPITFRFKAKLLGGYMGRYSISIGKRSTGVLIIGRASADLSPADTHALPVIAGQVEMGGERGDKAMPADRFFAETAAEARGEFDYTEITIIPDSNWLEPQQTFCAFNIALGGYLRSTDGENHIPSYNTTDVLIGIQRP